MKISTIQLLGGVVLCLSAFATEAASDAERTIENQYDAAISQADADYKTHVAACEGKSGNDKDVCLQQAKDLRDKAKVDARAARQSDSAVASATEEKNEADYKLARAKCNGFSGDAKDACISSAKAKYHQ